VVPSTFADGRVLASMLLLGALLLVAIMLRNKNTVLSFSILWIGVNLLPFLFIRLNDYMAERWIYLASIGACIAFAEILFLIVGRYRTAGIVLTSCVLLVGGTLTVMRNHVYTSPVLLWEDAAKKSPEKYRPLLNLSSAYLENGNSLMGIMYAEEAIKQWKIRGSRSRDIVVAYTNLASAPDVDARWSEKMLKAIEQEASGNVDYFGTRGAISLQAGKYKEALGSFKNALALSPQSAAFLYLIGECLENLGQKEAAHGYFVRATTVTPQTAQEFMGQGEAFSRLGDYQQASDRFHEAIRTDPLDVSMRVYFATIMLKNGYLDEAFKHFSIALQLSPAYAPAVKGMGLVMLRKGRAEDAARYFDRALDMLQPASTERKNVQELRDQARKEAQRIISP
jgi:tetratricopeptide (TPR) repeat protein